MSQDVLVPQQLPCQGPTLGLNIFPAQRIPQNIEVLMKASEWDTRTHVEPSIFILC